MKALQGSFTKKHYIIIIYIVFSMMDIKIFTTGGVWEELWEGRNFFF